jgi:hypothetical protein
MDKQQVLANVIATRKQSIAAIMRGDTKHAQDYLRRYFELKRLGDKL